MTRDEPLRIMTFNIRQGRALDGQNRWYKRRDMVFDVIATYAPHVLGAQEVNPNQLDELLARFPEMGAVEGRRYGGLFGASVPILFDRRRIEAGQAGDFWLQPDPEGRRTRGWDAMMPRICAWGTFLDRSTEQRFAVFNSHFDHRGKVAQVESAKLVAARMEAIAHLPRVFLADLNANESSEALRILLAGGFTDTYRVIRPQEEPSFTYHRFRGARSRGVLGKIDFILVDGAWEVVGAEIVRTGFGEGDEVRLPSDHYPVVADVGFRHETAQ